MAKILVVEDDPWSQRIFVELLEMRGHDVLAADTVGSARVQLEKAPEIVLLDIHVPGGGGEALLREIRASDAGARLPVIALTASAMAGDRERFVRQGFTAYMAKPIDVASFGPTVEHYVRAS
jgi:CheY-like chemotaxis protein